MTLIDPWIRHKAALWNTPMDRYRVQIARSSTMLASAFRLLHEAYVARGLQPPAQCDLRITGQHVLQESTVLVATEGDEVVGTMTLTLDSPAKLSLDKDYSTELDALRARNRLLVEYGSLAVGQRWRRTGVTTLLNIAAAWLSYRVLCATTVVIGINPEAAMLYRAIFGVVPLGPVQRHAQLEAPVLGMTQDIITSQEHMRRHFPRPMASGSTLYEHTAIRPPSCVVLPDPADHRGLPPGRLPRTVFRELFMSRSEHLYSLDPHVTQYLQCQRSPETLRSL